MNGWMMALACIVYLMIGIFVAELHELYDQDFSVAFLVTVFWPAITMAFIVVYVIGWLPHKLAVKARKSKWWKKWHL